MGAPVDFAAPRSSCQWRPGQEPGPGATNMRFLMIFSPDASATKRNEAGVPPSQEEFAEMGKLIEEMAKKGVLLSTEGCLPSSHGARVRRAGTSVSVTDGPFSEAKEVVGGFAIIKADSKAEAIEWAKRFLEVAGNGESMILQLHEKAAFGPA